MPSNAPLSWKRALVPGGATGSVLALGQWYLLLQTVPNTLPLLLILGLCLYLIVPTVIAWELRVRTDEPRQGYRCGVVAGVGSACVVLLLFFVILPLTTLHPFPPPHYVRGSGPWRDFGAYVVATEAVDAVVGVQLVGALLSLLGAWWGSHHR